MVLHWRDTKMNKAERHFSVLARVQSHERHDLLLESWIRVMYWVLVVILKKPFYPLKAKGICIIFTHILNIRGTVYTLSFCFSFNIFFNVQFMK